MGKYRLRLGIKVLVRLDERLFGIVNQKRRATDYETYKKLETRIKSIKINATFYNFEDSL